MRRATFLLLALCALPGCDRTAPPPNILLITLDTTRADRLGCYGYEPARTPTLDALAAKSWQFEDVTSPYPLTLPAHVSMLTGLYPFAHGARNNGMHPGDHVLTVTERLREVGYQTAAVVSAMVLRADAGLARGFDRYDDDTGDGAVERPADRTTDAALRALDGFSEDPFFLWVHYFDPHHPYDPPAAYALDDPYDGEIAFMDAQIQRLLEALGDRQPRTAILVTADHGEAFGEHGEWQHGLLVYETTTRVPLILSVPGETSRHIPTGASLVDVAPTLLMLARIDARLTTAVSLLDIGRGHGQDRAVTTESILPFYNHGAEPLAAVKQGRWKYVRAPRPELYDLAVDPGETHNLFFAQPQRAKELATLLAAAHPLEWTTGEVPQADVAIDEKTRQMLASLGYVADEHKGPTRADPKDLVEALDLVRRGDRYATHGEDVQAEAAFREALDRLPANWKATWRLGDFLVERDRLEEARRLYETARGTDPQNLAIALRLGEVLRLQGQAEAALEALEPLLRVYPDHRAARVERALSLMDLGRTAEARRDLQRLLKTQEDPRVRALLEQISN